MARYGWKSTLPKDASMGDLCRELERMLAEILEEFSGKDVAFMEINTPTKDGRTRVDVSWYFNEGEDWWEDDFPKTGDFMVSRGKD